MLKYIYQNTIWAVKDLNSKIEDYGATFAQNKVSVKNMKNLQSDDSLLYDFEDKGDYLLVENLLMKTYMISEFPQIIYPNWLYDLTHYNDPIVMSQFIHPIDSHKALAGLRNRITNLSAQYYSKVEKGKIHTTDIEQAIQDARNIEQSIVRGSEKLYAMSMYLKVASTTEEELSLRGKELMDLAYSKQLKVHSLKYKHSEGLENLLPKGVDHTDESLSLTSSNVSSTLPFTTATLNDPNGIFYGITMGGEKVRFDRFSKVSKNYNGIIFATSGAGKSFAAKLEAYRSLFKGIKVFVIDPEGEFKALSNFVGGTNIDINPESEIKVNPLQFFSTKKGSKETMRTHLGVVKGLLKIWVSKDAYNRGVISKAVNQTYEDKGIFLDDPETYTEEPPTISDLIKTFKESGEKGVEIATELLEYSKKGELGDLYDNPSSERIDFDSHMVVFNIQKVPDAEKQASIYFLSNFIWQKVLSDRDPKILIIDEAHLLLKEKSSADFIENLVRRGRKYNLGVISISQDVDDFLKNPQGSVIAKNAETALILGQKKQSIPSLVKAFELSRIENDYITKLTKGQALFIKGNIHSHMYIYPTAHEMSIFSSNLSAYVDSEDLAKEDLNFNHQSK